MKTHTKTHSVGHTEIYHGLFQIFRRLYNRRAANYAKVNWFWEERDFRKNRMRRNIYIIFTNISNEMRCCFFSWFFLRRSSWITPYPHNFDVSYTRLRKWIFEKHHCISVIKNIIWVDGEGPSVQVSGPLIVGSFSWRCTD